jgi:hypothetical protein
MLLSLSDQNPIHISNKLPFWTIVIVSVAHQKLLKEKERLNVLLSLEYFLLSPEHKVAQRIELRLWEILISDRSQKVLLNIFLRDLLQILFQQIPFLLKILLFSHR